MSASPVDEAGVTPVELQQRLRADRRGTPYLLFRNGAGEQRVLAFGDEQTQLTIGRASGCDVCLEWDAGVSRAHARLERLGRDDWMLADDGLSCNGSIVNGERLLHRRRLNDGASCASGARTSSTARRARRHARESRSCRTKARSI